MKRFHRLFAAAAIFFSAFAGLSSARADYLVTFEEVFVGDIWRLGNEGSVELKYELPPDVAESEDNFVETWPITHVTTPDLQTVYGFENTLGFSVGVYAFDVKTGAYLPDKTFGTSFGYGGGESYILQARQPIIRESDNSLFVISHVWDDGYTNDSVIKWFDLSAVGDKYVHTFELPLQQDVFDLALAPGGQLYASGEDGVFFVEGTWDAPDPLGPMGPLPHPGMLPVIDNATGYIAIAGNLLYLSNSSNGNIERYNRWSGDFVDTYLAGAELGGSFGTIQFGVDGNLHAHFTPTGGNWSDISLLRIHGPTGQVLSRIDPIESPNPFQYGRATYLPIPEPASLALLLLGAAMMCSRWRRNA